MAEFIETLKSLENISKTLAGMNGEGLSAAIERMKIIGEYLDKYNNLADILKHFKAVEERLFTEKEMLSVQEAARYMDVSRDFIYRLTAAHEITFYKPTSKLVFIPRKELDEYMHRNAVLSTTDIQRKAIAFTSLNRIKKRGGERC
jgi:excisionase family DNA binding protein